MPRGIRSRAVLVAVTATLLIGIALGAASFILVGRVTLSSLHEIVSAHLDDVSEQFNDPGAAAPNEIVFEAVESTNPVYVRATAVDGTVIAETPGIPPGVNLCADDSAHVQETRTVSSPKLGEVTLCAATSKQPAFQAERDVLILLLVVIPLAIAGVAGAVWMAVGRALSSVEGLRRQAEVMTSIGDGALDVEPTGDEVELLGETLNDLLSRLHAQSRATQQFIADAGHELRNPLATLRVTLEFQQHDGAEHALALAELDRLETLVQDLLVLARTEAHETPAMSDVDLGRVIDEAVRAVRQQNPDITVIVETEPVLVTGDERTLRGAVDNLILNAARHCVSEVRIGLVRSAGRAIISVDDDGRGVSEADCPRVFERFVRLDESRQRDEGGSGLGLAIVSATAFAHDGHAWAEPGPGGHFRFEIPAH